MTGMELTSALAARDFPGVERCLAPDARVRALVTSGPLELDGAPAVAERLERWFGGGGDLRLLASGSDWVRDRLHIWYRLRFDDHPLKPDSGPQVVEQHLFCALDGGRITDADLLCSGFRPA